MWQITCGRILQAMHSHSIQIHRARRSTLFQKQFFTEKCQLFVILSHELFLGCHHWHVGMRQSTSIFDLTLGIVTSGTRWVSRGGYFPWSSKGVLQKNCNTIVTLPIVVVDMNLSNKHSKNTSNNKMSIHFPAANPNANGRKMNSCQFPITHTYLTRWTCT